MSDSPRPTRFLLMQGPSRDGRFLGTTNLPLLRDALGPSVLAEFCRCFLHLDRLLSFRALGHYSDASATVVGKQRDFATVTWMIIGTMRELGTAFDALRVALVKANLFEATSEWEEIQEIVGESKDERRRLRNEGAFHVDPKLIEQGLKDLSADSAQAILFVHGGENDLGFSFQLAIEALYKGLNMSDSEIKAFMTSLLGDVDRVSRLLPSVFVGTMKRAGVTGFGI